MSQLRADPEVSRTDADLAREVERWQHAPPGAADLDGLRLARLVTHEMRSSGQHLLADSLLDPLETIQRRHRGHDRHLDAYLDSVLARRHDRFRTQTYLRL